MGFPSLLLKTVLIPPVMEPGEYTIAGAETDEIFPIGTDTVLKTIQILKDGSFYLDIYGAQTWHIYTPSSYFYITKNGITQTLTYQYKQINAGSWAGSFNNVSSVNPVPTFPPYYSSPCNTGTSNLNSHFLFRVTLNGLSVGDVISIVGRSRSAGCSESLNIFYMRLKGSINDTSYATVTNS